jgi:hypothetical protein
VTPFISHAPKLVTVPSVPELSCPILPHCTKYLYADGDPINGTDPTGRVDFIETIFTRTYVSSPLDLGTEAVARSVTGVFCTVAKVVAAALQGVPPGIVPLPLWPVRPLAALCTTFGC